VAVDLSIRRTQDRTVTLPYLLLFLVVVAAVTAVGPARLPRWLRLALAVCSLLQAPFCILLFVGSVLGDRVPGSDGTRHWSPAVQFEAQASFAAFVVTFWLFFEFVARRWWRVAESAGNGGWQAPVSKALLVGRLLLVAVPFVFAAAGIVGQNLNTTGPVWGEAFSLLAVLAFPTLAPPVLAALAVWPRPAAIATGSPAPAA
jgi:hypothetical protein